MADRIRFNSKFDLQNNYEPSDSENEYSTSEKQILDKLKQKVQDSGSDEELYAFSDSDADSIDKNDLNIANSDVEGQDESDDDLPDSKAWGKKKKSYYSTDYVDEDYGGFGIDENDALLEEEEAKNIQKRLLEQLGEEDYMLEFYKEPVNKGEGDYLIKSDVSQMSKRQKLQLLEKESPEFSGLIDDFKLKFTIAKDMLYPVLELIKNGKLPNCSASKFIKTKYDMILNYCTNISFYLLLKSQKINIQNHPVVKRLYQYRQMLKKIEPYYLEIIKPQIDKILNAVENNLALQLIKENMKNKKRKSVKQPEYPAKKLKLINSLEKENTEDIAILNSNDMKPMINNNKFDNRHKIVKQSEESVSSDNNKVKNEQNRSFNSTQEIISEDMADKREITYQIAKNKGLTPHRKKEQRNPRVKHKLKYRKAKIRRKGAIREHRTETVRYGGEPSGIKANVKKSIKIK